MSVGSSTAMERSRTRKKEMLMKQLLCFAVLLAVFSCNGNSPPPPPLECGENESCQCIEGYERNDEGVCVEIPPPPPPRQTQYGLRFAGSGVKPDLVL